MGIALYSGIAVGVYTCMSALYPRNSHLKLYIEYFCSLCFYFLRLFSLSVSVSVSLSLSLSLSCTHTHIHTHTYTIKYCGRDTPGDVTDFWLVSNSSKKDCEIKIEGKSLFSVLR